MLALFVSGCGEEQDSERPAQANDSFPVSIEHKFGETVVEQPPRRVVTVGFNDQDFALALGGAQPQLVGAEELESRRSPRSART